MLCPECGQKNDDGAKFCAECGSVITVKETPEGDTVLICPSCGVKNVPGARFCSECGSSLAPAPAPKPVEPPKAPEPVVAPAPKPVEPPKAPEPVVAPAPAPKPVEPPKAPKLVVAPAPAPKPVEPPKAPEPEVAPAPAPKPVEPPKAPELVVAPAPAPKPVESPKAPKPVEAPKEPVEEPKKSNKTMMIAAGAVAAVVIGAAAFFFSGSKGNDSIDKYVAALNKKDFAQAVTMIDGEFKAGQLEQYASEKANAEGSVFLVQNGKVSDVKVLNKKDNGDVTIYTVEAKVDGKPQQFTLNVNKKTNKIVLPADDFVEVNFVVPGGAELTVDGAKVETGKPAKVFLGKHKIELSHPLLDVKFKPSVSVEKAGNVAVLESATVKADKAGVLEAAGLDLAKDIFQAAMTADTMTLAYEKYTKTADANGKLAKMHEALRKYMQNNSVSKMDITGGKLQGQEVKIDENKAVLRCVYQYEGNMIKAGSHKAVRGTLDFTVEGNGDKLKIGSLEYYNVHLSR